MALWPITIIKDNLSSNLAFLLVKLLIFQLWYQQPLRICLLITACNKNDTVSQWYLKQQGIDKAILNENGAEINSQCEVWFNLLMRENKEHFSFLAYELAYNCLTSKQGQLNQALNGTILCQYLKRL